MPIYAKKEFRSQNPESRIRQKNYSWFCSYSEFWLLDSGFVISRVDLKQLTGPAHNPSTGHHAVDLVGPLKDLGQLGVPHQFLDYRPSHVS